MVIIIADLRREKCRRDKHCHPKAKCVSKDPAFVKEMPWEMECTVEVRFNVINYLYQDHGFIYRFMYNPGPTCSKQS